MGIKNSLISEHERAKIISKFYKVMSAEGIDSDEVTPCVITRTNDNNNYTVIYLIESLIKDINISIGVEYKSIW